jgi:hypothetical protein
MHEWLRRVTSFHCADRLSLLWWFSEILNRLVNRSQEAMSALNSFLIIRWDTMERVCNKLILRAFSRYRETTFIGASGVGRWETMRQWFALFCLSLSLSDFYPLPYHPKPVV